MNITFDYIVNHPLKLFDVIDNNKPLLTEEKLKDIKKEIYQTISTSNIDLKKEVIKKYDSLFDLTKKDEWSEKFYKKRLNDHLETILNNMYNDRKYIYILSNPFMPNIIKIGYTNDLKRRINELFNTSLPTPFKLEFNVLINIKSGDKIIHKFLDNYIPNSRCSDKREFYKLSPSLIYYLFIISGYKVEGISKKFNLTEEEKDILKDIYIKFNPSCNYEYECIQLKEDYNKLKEKYDNLKNQFTGLNKKYIELKEKIKLSSQSKEYNILKKQQEAIEKENLFNDIWD